MASKEKIKKKKTKAPSPAVGRKNKSHKEKVVIQATEEKQEAEPEDVQGSQVSVRSATGDNIRDNTQEEDFRDEDGATPVPQPSSESPVPATSMNRKRRDDHVDEKLGRETTPSPSQTLTTKGDKKRSISPMNKNNVSPGMSSMGSAVSLRSNISHTSKEAWMDKPEKESEPAAGNRKKAKVSGSLLSLSRENKVGPAVIPSHTNVQSMPRPTSGSTGVTRVDQERKSQGLQNIKVEEDEDSPEKHAYIPYLYARNCIAKIMEDMKAMKGNHVVIVENITQHYSTIETETQEQFNMYVLCIKEDYANKQKAFRQVIDVHRVEVEKKEQYWNEMLASLAERNNRLLREKKTLLVHNKTEIERLEREKTNITKDLTEKIDKMALLPVPVKSNKPVSSDMAQGASGAQSAVAAGQGTSSQETTVIPGPSAAQTKTETTDISKTAVKEDKTPVKDAKTPEKETKTPEKETKTPEKDAKTPEKETKTPEKDAKTPEKETKTPEKDAKTPEKESKAANKDGEGVSEPSVKKSKPVESTEKAGLITPLVDGSSPALPTPQGSGPTELGSTLDSKPVSSSVPAELEKLEAEKKILQDQLETEKATIAELQQQLAGHSVSTKVMTPGTAQVETATVETTEMSGAGGARGTAVAAGALALTKENNKQMEKERDEMEEERSRLTEERQKLDEERDGFGEQKEKWLGEIGKLQSQLAERDTEGGEWKTKYDVMKARLDEAGTMQAKYQALENQYAALALIVKDADTSGPVKEQLEKTQEEKVMMEEEKQGLEKEIKTWENEFEKKNGHKPTEEDKSDSVKEMYTTQGELEYMVTNLQQKETTLKQVEQGTIPEAPVAPIKPIDTREPEVVTVQVKVPDPTVVEELTRSTHEITTIRTEVTILQQEVSDMNGKISKQNQQLANERTKVAELETQLKAGGAVPMAISTGGGASEEELEALKKENRELRRDMKKMIKQYQRLVERNENAGHGGNESEQMAEMAEAMGEMDNRVMDLEAENEAMKEERLILREKVRTITETITITHTEDNKKVVEEKDRKIDELLKALEEERAENSEMQKDMKKMVKTHAKMKARLEELKLAEKAVQLLEVVAMLIHQIHCEVPDASSKVNIQLDDLENQTAQSKQVLDTKQAAYQQWVDEYEKKNGKVPGKGDRDADGEKLHADWEIAKRDFKEKHLHMSALQLIKTGDVSQAVGKSENIAMKAEIEVSTLEKALQAADNKMIDLETQNKNVTMDRDRYKDKVGELETMMDELQTQAELNKTLLADSESSAELTEQLGELQKKADSFEADLMQERMSHVNTRDEMETLRKQLDVLREELETEKQGMEARVDGVKAHMEAQIGDKDGELKDLQARNDELEAARLSNLPPDTAAEIKQLQDKLKQIKEDKSSTKNSSAALTAMVAELTSKLDTTSKNLETQRSSNRELEAKLKANRHDKEKETKRVSRHMEEKQQKSQSEDKQRITMLVKRVKELESKAGKVGVAAGPVVAAAAGSDGANTHILKREIKDQAAQIKQLEKELRAGGGAAAGGGGKGESAADRMKAGKQEKILKELEKKLDHEKNKSEKLMEGLKAADEENQSLQKELAEKNRNLAKVSGELKTISAAAKEGVEAAMKVKELAADNKKLESENVILTKNFESERVLRKKYFNIVEDMKGKIRVYCRARPLSKSELDRGNRAVCTSGDEYSLSVESTRGMKDFQYDQVFMEDSTQEKIFEDTHNLIQSAVDGYNVCIFAYGQTGSGKTFTMIGDREQKFPGIAPRAFNGIFDLIDELKSKFTITVEAYMLELYNDRLIDLFSKPAGDDEKLEIKKDKKGMVTIQGAVIKKAKNAKELFALFEEGSTNRHTASTKMNAESSRSHLVIGIIMESTNKNTGNVTKGKLSLVDLAGSERVAKTQAGAEQLKEAMSINKSLSALGDVISALSSEQQFIPYRNNKLTMLMQDSLGGNAKTLMFVNISPADYNADETVISLTYASRVKLITNDASKNADNKEIARLRNVIAAMKKGESVEEED